MRYVEIWNQIKHLIKSKSNNSDNYDEKNIEIKFNSDSFFFFLNWDSMHARLNSFNETWDFPPFYQNLPLRKTLKMQEMMTHLFSMMGMSIIHMLFLDEYLLKLAE